MAGPSISSSLTDINNKLTNLEITDCREQGRNTNHLLRIPLQLLLKFTTIQIIHYIALPIITPLPIYTVDCHDLLGHLSTTESSLMSLATPVTSQAVC